MDKLKLVKATLVLAALVIAIFQPSVSVADDIFEGFIPCTKNNSCKNKPGDKEDDEVGRIGAEVPINHGDDVVIDATPVRPPEPPAPPPPPPDEKVTEANSAMCAVDQPLFKHVFQPKPDLDAPNNCKEVGCRNGNLVERPDNDDLSDEDKQCKYCLERTVATKAGGTPCEDGLFCTSKNGYDPGPDQCKEGVCEGSPIIREKLTEVRTEVKNPVQLLETAHGVLATLTGVPWIPWADLIGELHVVGYREITVRECCESTPEEKGYIDIVNGSQATIELTRKPLVQEPILNEKDERGEKKDGVPIPIHPIINRLIDPRFIFDGEIKLRGILEDIETMCSSNCNKSGSVVANAKLLAGISAVLLNESILEVKGGLTFEGSLGSKLNCKGLNPFGCVGPLGGEITVKTFIGVSRRWSGKLPGTVTCMGTDGGTVSD